MNSLSRYMMLLSYILLTIPLHADDIYTIRIEDFSLMRENFLKKIAFGGEENINMTDQKVNSYITSITADAKKYQQSMQKNPTSYLWSDYNKLKGDAARTPKHVYYTYGRLLKMTQAYSYPGRLHQDENLLNSIISGLDFMYAFAFNETTQRIGNFWEWHMGIPDYYAHIISLIYDKVPQKTKENYYKTIISQMRQFVSTGNYTYGNQATACMELLYCGILCNSTKDIEIALNNLIRAFVDNTTIEERKTAQKAFEKLVENQGDYHNYMPSLSKKEGLYPDGTFIQHIALPYIGGYGREMVKALAQCQAIFEGTDIHIPQDIINSFYTWAIKAYFPAIYEGEMMLPFMGRGTKQNPHENAKAVILDIAEAAYLLDKTKQTEVRSICKRHLGNNTYYSDIYSGVNPIIDKPRIDHLLQDALIPIAENVPYHLTMAAGDRIIHNQPHYRFAISMSSSRIGKFESLNNENTQGWHSGDGMTYLYNQTDRSQYVNYFSTVNPQRLPGTTVDVLSRSPLTTSNYGLFGLPKGANHWTGGTQLNNCGVAGMHLLNELGTLEAYKSWFMFDKEIVAVGAGITMAEDRAAETIIENRKGINQIIIDGISKAPNQPWTDTFISQWINFEETGGYYFPNPTEVKVERDSKGFSLLYIDHGIKPQNETYAYTILPGLKQEEIKEYILKPEIEIISNTKEIQAVKNLRNNMLAINFWKPGKIETISSYGPVSVLLQEKDEAIFLAISDPTWKESNIRLTLDGYYDFTNDVEGVIVSQAGEATIILLDATDKMGATTSLVLHKRSSSLKMLKEEMKPSFSVLDKSGLIHLTNIIRPCTLTVSDIYGIQLVEYLIDSIDYELDLTSFGKGCYIINLYENNKQNHIWKFLK